MDAMLNKPPLCPPIVLHRLLMALATAKCCPSVAWLQHQQASLSRSLAATNLREEEGLDAATAAELRTAYATWKVPLSSELQSQLAQRAL